VEKWYFSRANVSPTICSLLIYSAGDVPKAEGFAEDNPGIVTLAFRMTRLEGTLKLSQNRSRTDQQWVAASLQQSADPLSRDVGTSMQQRQAARRT
jgi:predicted FMN-binding regulatory protein PaiB